MFQFTQALHHSDAWRRLCYASRPVGGTPALSPPSLCLSFLHLHSFPSSPFSVILLFWNSSPPQSSSVFLEPVCSLAHTHTHTLFQVIPPLVPLFHKCWTSIFLPFIPLSLQSLIFGACLLFCCGFLMDFENCSTSSPIQSTWNKIYTHWQQITKDISSLTLFLLYPFVIHCTTVLQRVIISMAIHTNALSVCCLIGRRSKKQ